MAVKQLCTQCDGEGLKPREGDEAKADLHPLLANSKGLCDHCGGSGAEPISHAGNVSSAQGQSG